MSNGNEQQYTVKELADQLRPLNPEVKDWSDDKIVQQFVAQNPSWLPRIKYQLPPPGPGPSSISAIPSLPARALSQTKGFARAAGREVVEALPALGATIGGIAGTPGGPPGIVGGAVIGGSGGEAGRQLFEHGLGLPAAPKTSAEAGQRIVQSGLEQGIWEMLGHLFSPRGFRPGTVAGEEVGAKDLYKMSRTPGFKMTASQIRGTPAGITETVSGLGMWSRKAIEGYKRSTIEGAEKLATKLLDSIAAKGTPEFSGQFLQDSLNKAFTAFKAEGASYYRPFRGSFGEGIPTSFDELVKLANDMQMERTRLVKTADPKIFERLPAESPADTLLNAIKNLKEQPQNFKTAMEVRDFLHRYLPGHDQLFKDTEAEAMASRFWKKLGDRLSKDAAAFDRANPGQTASPQWEQAKTFWGQGRERFEKTFYTGLVQKNPEFVAKSLSPGNVTDVKLLKSILTEYGSPAERARGQEAWRGFQRSFAEHRIINDPSEKEFTLKSLQKMKTNMDKLGGPQLREIYSDPAGQEFLKNMRAFAELMSRTDFQGGLKAGKWEVMYDIVGLMGSVGVGAYQKSPQDVFVGTAMVQGIPRFFTALFHSRTATALLLKSIMVPPPNKTAIAMRIVAETVKALQRSEEDPYKGVNLHEGVPVQ